MDIKSQAEIALKYMVLLCYWASGNIDIRKAKEKATEWYPTVISFFQHFGLLKTVEKALARLQADILHGHQTINDQREADIVVVGDFLKRLAVGMSKEVSIHRTTLSLFEKCSTYLRRYSTPAWTVIHKAAGDIDTLFDSGRQEVGLQDSHVLELVRLVESVTGRRDVRLSSTERESLRASNPELYQKFLDLKLTLVKLAGQAIRSYVRSASTKDENGTVDYDELRGFLTTHHILHDLPDGFVGRIDEKVNFYTSEGLELKARPYFPVKMNADYDPEEDNSYYCSCLTDKGNTQYFQTLRVTTENRKDRFDLVEEFIPELPAIRAKWLRDLKGNDEKKKVLAAMLELTYWASARIGSPGNKTAGQETYGISTLLKEHVLKQGTHLIVDYRGKKGVKQKHDLVPRTPEDKVCATIVWKLAQAAEEGARIFPYSATAVNRYLKSLGSLVTVHKLRHARATTIMLKQLETCPLMKRKRVTQKEADDWYKNAALEVGKELGHVSGESITWSTAVSAYVDPSVTLGYFKKLNLRTPTWAEKFEDD